MRARFLLFFWPFRVSPSYRNIIGGGVTSCPFANGKAERTDDMMMGTQVTQGREGGREGGSLGEVRSQEVNNDSGFSLNKQMRPPSLPCLPMVMRIRHAHDIFLLSLSLSLSLSRIRLRPREGPE